MVKYKMFNCPTIKINKDCKKQQHEKENDRGYYRSSKQYMEDKLTVIRNRNNMSKTTQSKNWR